MKLLLVDDEPGIREGLAALLRRKGHEVVTAADCAGATAAIAGHAGGAGLDLVLTDWRLPDGVAAGFLGGVGCPAIAMSGHPEEIAGQAEVREVLTKPVAIGALLARLAAFAAELEQRRGQAAIPSLPQDVARLVGRMAELLGCVPETTDDGAFVTARAPAPDAAGITALLALGGDLRVLAPGGIDTVEIRWCRDGRPDPSLPVCEPDDRWPDARELAIDFSPFASAGDTAGPRFARCLDRAALLRADGRIVHFLNVPDALLSWTSDQGRDADLPMRAAVGPRLPAVLADLWSQA
ncbi:MAG: response regulator [Planctomycetes bacterium]|nr:response regulator [Planctomycetota bacterium]